MHCIAYIAGLVASDGHLSTRDYRLKVVTYDKRFAEYLTRNTSLFKVYRHGKVFELYCYNKNLWNTLNKDYRIPCGKKSNTIQPPKELAPTEAVDFLRGLFDGDSSIYIVQVKLRRKQQVYKYLLPRISFKSKSEALTNWAFNQLRKLGLKPYYSNEPTFHRFFLDGFTNLRKFHEKIGYRHPAKRKKLEGLLNFPHNYYAPVAGEGVRNSSPAEEGGPEN